MRWLRGSAGYAENERPYGGDYSVRDQAETSWQHGLPTGLCALDADSMRSAAESARQSVPSVRFVGGRLLLEHACRQPPGAALNCVSDLVHFMCNRIGDVKKVVDAPYDLILLGLGG